ncbi:flavodoxin family protein [Alkalibaculum sp. M08DMB]|uniref:Flavodoxin family protein n=1 Tax=Alkalibaculum sporogenes TaxID=2655001 RepID=A0A6A7K4W7_9FIRM|nr:flavodoxin family protein [Alkalibaculum sporogenes]MPW24364.1 flavodoxin family protein [Alkalibaculum sporogenes]
MKVVAYNASPRKDWNTANLLQSALRGAASIGADTELIHLYDLKYKGCTSCFACKLKDGKSYGKCAMTDDLTPLLESFTNADAVVIGSPIYFGDVTGMLRCLLERLWFPYLVYTKEDNRTLFSKKLNTLFVYTMNMPEEAVKITKFDESLSSNERLCNMIFGGNSQSYLSTETLQFSDYSKYVSDMFKVEQRMKRHQEVFPVDLENVYNLGIQLLDK